MNSPFFVFVRHNFSRISPKTKGGFTLIELLVVISIIAILSSIILAAVSGARQSAMYAAVQEELVQMRSSYELQYSSANAYTVLMPSGMPSYATCFTTGANNYCIVTSISGCDTLYTAASQSDNICRNIINTAGSFVFGVINSAVPDDVNDYAFAVPNPSNTNSYFCIRSSGGNTVINTTATNCLTKSNW